MRSPDPWLAIPVSLLAGLSLTVLPLPDVLAPWRPDWLLLLLLFWAYQQPEWVGEWSAFAVGVVMDVIFGTPLGLYAFSSCLAVWAARRLARRWRRTPLFLLAPGVAMLAALAALVRYGWLTTLGQPPDAGLYWLPALGNLLAWPLVFLALLRWRRPILPEGD